MEIGMSFFQAKEKVLLQVISYVYNLTLVYSNILSKFKRLVWKYKDRNHRIHL